MQQDAKERNGIAGIAALILLSLIWAWSSLRADLLPRSAVTMSVTPLVMQALLLAIFAALAAPAGLIRKAQWPRGSFLLLNLFVGLGLFLLPAVLVELGKDWIDDSTRVALFSLVPVLAAVFEPHIGSPSKPQTQSALGAALIAVLGTLLVFPVDVPHSVPATLAFCGVLVAAVSVAAANCLGVRLRSDQPQTSGFTFAATAAGCAALCLGAIGCFVGRRHEAAVPIDLWGAPDLVALALLFWLMRRMSAVRMTTRFLIAPLLANLIGLSILRPHVQLQSWAGLLLIAFGAGWLLFAPEGEPAPTSSPLGIP